MRKRDPEKAKKYRRDWYYRNQNRAINSKQARLDRIKESLDKHLQAQGCQKCNGHDDLCFCTNGKKDTVLSRKIHDGLSFESILDYVASNSCNILCKHCR